MMVAHRGKSRHRSTSRVVAMVGLGLCVGLTMLLMCSLGWDSTSWRPVQVDRRASAAAGAETEPVQFVVEKPPKRCWVFNHQHRAGGSTIKYMLQAWADRRGEETSVGIYDSTQWLRGEEFARDFLAEENTLTWGAYTEGLRPHGGADKCKWFTIFRHPIARLVSAYYYCKKSPVDGLCASVVLRANETDIHTFAEHWGNYGLRQFALAYALPEQVIASEAGSQHRCVPQRGRKECPGWYRLKLYLEGIIRSAEEPVKEGGLPALRSSKRAAMKDDAMVELIQPVTELLNDKYAAVGILEHWGSSMLLFQRTLRLPAYNWTQGSRNMGKKNGNGMFKKEENAALAMAWTDPKLKNSLMLDLVLYDHAVSVFRRQMAQHGLTVLE
eukprot:g4522.t1